MRTLVLASAALLPLGALAACAKPTPEPAKVTAPSPEPSSAPGDAPSAPAQRGIEVGDLNRGADPCTDFYEFANGAWRAQNPIPDGRPRWGRRNLARETNRKAVAAIIQELAAKPDWTAGSPEQLVGDTYASCMDEAAIDAAGLSPIAPLLAEIDAARTPADVQRAMRRLTLLGIAAPLGETATFENREPANTLLNLTAGGLGLDRDAYLKPEPAAAALRTRYRDHLARMLVLGGAPQKDSVAAADRVLALEKKLAAATLDAKVSGDPAAVEHKTTFAQLKALAPRLEWDRYFDEAKLAHQPVNVTEPKFLQQLDKELQATPVATWKAYLKWRLLDAAAPWLARPFAEEAFAFRGKTLGGATEMPPRDQRCLELTEKLLGEPVGRKYADQHFTPEAKAKAREISNNLLAAMRESMSSLAWMAPETRSKALEKIDQMSLQLGYPDSWKDTSKLQIRRDAFWANVAQARQFIVNDLRGQAGKPTNRAGWQLPPSSPDAYIDLQLNQLVLPAGFLQPPYFDVQGTDAKNYGALGAGLAHDMTHAFDAVGAALDAAGRAQPWWSDADQQEFQKRAQCIVGQYDGYAIEPGVNHQGKKVLNEVLGDQAGLHFSFIALKKSMATRPVPTVDGFTPEQQFFIAWGQFRGEAVRLEAQRQIVKDGPHAVPKFRVNGPMSNLPGFEQAFACKAGAAMARPIAQRCIVW